MTLTFQAGTPFDLLAVTAVTLRLGLAGLLLVSAVGKAWDLPGTRQTLAEFGVAPQRTQRASHLLLAAEALIALMLLCDSLTRAGAGLAAGLFLVFTLGIANVLRQGRRPDCHCLGQLHSAPVGPLVLVRNLALVAASLFVARQPVTLLTATPASQLAALLGGACVALASSHLALWQSLRAKANPYLKPGQLVPHLDLLAQDGQRHSIHTLLPKDRQSLIVFSSPTCGHCLPLLPKIIQWRAMLADRLTVLLLDVAAEGAEHEWPEGSYRVAAEALHLYKVGGTPGAILLDGQGRVVLPKPASGADEILATVRAALTDQPPAL